MMRKLLLKSFILLMSVGGFKASAFAAAAGVPPLLPKVFPEVVLDAACLPGLALDFNLLIAQHGARIRNAIRKRGLETNEVGEVYQTTLINISSNLFKLKDPQAFLGWALTIAANCTRDFIARKAEERRRTDSLDDHVRTHAAQNSSSSREEKDSAKLKFVKIFREMISQEERIARGAEGARMIKDMRLNVRFFLLSNFDGWKYKEIAQAHQMTEGSIKTRMHYFRKYLTGYLQKNRIDPAQFFQ